MLTTVEISRILILALVAYSEHLYFSISFALISTAAKFIIGSDDFWISCNIRPASCSEP